MAEEYIGEVLPFISDEQLAAQDAALNIPAGTTKKQLMQESGMNPFAVSPKGAKGLSQVMDVTRQTLEQRVGRPLDPFIVEDSLLMHKMVMQENLQRTKGNLSQALSLYNSGKINGTSEETTNYIKSILGDTTSREYNGPIAERFPNSPTMEALRNLDIAANELIGGEHETLSSRIGKAANAGNPMASAAASALDAIDPGHTDVAAALSTAKEYTGPVEYTAVPYEGPVILDNSIDKYMPNLDRIKKGITSLEGMTIPKAAAGAATGLLGAISGLGTTAVLGPLESHGLIEKGTAARTANKVSSALTYTPSDSAARGLVEGLGAVFGLPTEAIKASEKIPNYFADLLGQPHPEEVSPIQAALIQQAAGFSLARPRQPEIFQQGSLTGVPISPKAAARPSEAPTVPLSPNVATLPSLLKQTPSSPVSEAVRANVAAATKPAKGVLAGEKTPPTVPPNTDLYSWERIPDDPLAAELKPEIYDKLSKAGIDYFENNGGYIPGLTVADNLVALVNKGVIGDSILDKYGLNAKELIDAFEKSKTTSGQRLAYLSHVARAVNLTAEQADMLKKQGFQIEDSVVMRPFLQELDGFRRAMMTSQFGTAIGNVVGQSHKVGFDVIQAPLDFTLQKIIGLPNTVHPLDGFEQMVSIFGHNKNLVNGILEAFPKQYDRMFQMYAGDLLDSAGKKVGAVTLMDKAAHIATWANRLQEFTTRRGVFQAALDHELRNRGYDFRQVINDYGLESGSFNTFKAYNKDPQFLSDFNDSIKAAVDKSLEVTFAKKPEYGSVPYHILQAINKMPFIGTAVIPFGNYFYNALKFTLDYSPVGLLQYLSKSERAAFMAGDTNKISRAIIGVGMLGAAIQMRNDPELSKGKFYELTLPDGKRMDLRPYGATYVPYLFAADIMKKSKEGTLDTITEKDILDGIAGFNFRGGTGLDIVDMFLMGMTNQGATKKEKATQAAKEYVGGTAAQFFTPFQQLRDIYDQVTLGTNQNIKDTKVGNPLLDPTLNKLPWFSQQLPNVVSPMTTETPKILNPMLKQALSIRLSPAYTDVENALREAGITAGELYPRGLSREIAYDYAINMGPLVENSLSPLVRNPRFQSLTRVQQTEILKLIVNTLKTPAMGKTIASMPMDQRRQFLYEQQNKIVQEQLKLKGLMK